MKYNPFRPNNAVVPGMFVGRVEELDTIEQCMYQTKNNNPQHFLIHGERGIGKTSLLDYVKSIANSEFSTLDDVNFNFITVAIDVGGCTTNLDLVRKIGRGFRQELKENEILKTKAKSVWDWISHWEILGVKYNKPGSSLSVDIEEIIDDFVFQLSVFCNKTQGMLDGVFFLIDEADRPPVEANFGEFLKFTTERLGRRGCHSVLFGLAGLPPLLGKLRESHESSPRLFQIMLLEPLEIDERKRVVHMGLKESNSKNKNDTSIDEDALDFLAELSEGYPHFVQQFAFSAFEEDSDDRIDIDDVGNGAFKESGALSQLGNKFFSDMYYARVYSEDYRRVLDSMANHGDQWVARRIIIKESAVSKGSVSNALRSLKDKEVILKDGTRHGYYRLPNRSFAVWINAMNSAAAKKDVESSH